MLSSSNKYRFQAAQSQGTGGNYKKSVIFVIATNNVCGVRQQVIVLKRLVVELQELLAKVTDFCKKLTGKKKPGLMSFLRAIVKGA